MSAVLLAALVAACGFDTGGRSHGGPADAAPDPDIDADTATGPDAADPGPGGFDASFEPQLVEHMVIPTDDAPIVTSVNALALGTTYELRASGTMQLSDSQALTADAEYWWQDSSPGNTMDSATIGESTIDIGLAINDTVIDATTNPSWGAFAADHVYSVRFVGEGAMITAQFHDLNGANNSGELALDIYTVPD
jgi:hypothetical protein